MPTQLLVIANQAAPSLRLEFLDDEGNIVNTPDGATVAFSVDYDQIIALEQSPSDQTVAAVRFGNITSLSIATITVTVTGANDTDGNPYRPQLIQAVITPGTPAVSLPAKPPSIQFQIVQA